MSSSEPPSSTQACTAATSLSLKALGVGSAQFDWLTAAADWR
jgi:hypothetical protein